MCSPIVTSTIKEAAFDPERNAQERVNALEAGRQMEQLPVGGCDQSKSNLLKPVPPTFPQKQVGKRLVPWDVIGSGRGCREMFLQKRGGADA